jgi:anti-sigma factor (TIGR02949 family)
MADHEGTARDEGTLGMSGNTGGNCDDVLRQLYSFIDGWLTDDRRSRITNHLDECGHCVDAYDFEAELRSVVARHAYCEVPAELKQRIFSLLSTESPAVPRELANPLHRPSPFGRPFPG